MNLDPATLLSDDIREDDSPDRTIRLLHGPRHR